MTLAAPSRVLAAVIAGIAVLVYGHVLPLLPAMDVWPSTTFVLAGLALLGLFVAELVPPDDPRLELAAAAAVAGLAIALVATWLNASVEASAAKAIAAAAVGCVLASYVRLREVILIAVVVIGADFYSVFYGPTKEIINHHPHVLSAFSLDVRGPDNRNGGGIGVSDLLFLAFFTASARRRALSIAAMVVSLPTTYALAVALDRPLPALPLLSVAFLTLNAWPWPAGEDYGV